MPFDLFIRPLNGGERVAAMALECAPLPADSAVKTIHTPGYRDRYAIVSGDELLAMIDAKDALVLKAMMEKEWEGPIERRPAYLLHWEEWESGR